MPCAGSRRGNAGAPVGKLNWKEGLRESNPSLVNRVSEGRGRPTRRSEGLRQVRTMSGWWVAVPLAADAVQSQPGG
ncbi:MAG: hypothetical protein OXG81_12725 [Acidobacteria bacterium]|nr:hypothetical protein [Acidobacteriota bacterium]